MTIDTENMISISEVNQNFSKIVKKVDANGKVVVLKNNKPKYVILPIDDERVKLSDEEIIKVVATRILNEHKKAFEELAK